MFFYVCPVPVFTDRSKFIGTVIGWQSTYGTLDESISKARVPVTLLYFWPACTALLRSLCPRLRDRRSFQSLHPFLILTPNPQARLVFSICASDYLGFGLVSFLDFLFLFAGLCLPAVLFCSLGSSVASCGGFVSFSVSSLASAFWGRPYPCPHGDGADAGTNASGASALKPHHGEEQSPAVQPPFSRHVSNGSGHFTGCTLAFTTGTPDIQATTHDITSRRHLLRRGGSNTHTLRGL